jgi:striatin 1/3/4
MLGSVQQNKGPSILQQQPQLPQSQQPQGGPDVPPPPLNGQDFTLSNVLHFLQSEWRKYERDRNEWEIERAEMRVRSFALAYTCHAFSFLSVLGPHRTSRG